MKQLNGYNWKNKFWSADEAQKILGMGINAFASSIIMRRSPSEAKFFLLGAAFDFGTNGFKKESEEALEIVAAIFGEKDAAIVRSCIEQFEGSGQRASVKAACADRIYKDYNPVQIFFL